MTKRFTATPFDLAIFRIVVCAVVLAFTDVPNMRAIAGLPASLATAKTSLAFPLAWLPIDPLATEVTGYVVKVGCTLGVIGLWTRPALVIATLASLYFLGVAQHAGAVVHHHHYSWFLAVLAASPCDDVLSVSAARRAAAGHARPPKRSLAYGVPVWTARVLIGVIFFFPGLYKLLEAGLPWITSDNLRNQMYWKWFEHGVMAPWRIDRHPWLMRALAGGAVVFELSLLPLLFSKRARPWAAGGAFGFHMFTEVFMHIRFTALWPCYVVLLDAHAALRGLAAEVMPTKRVITGTPSRIAVIRSLDVFGRFIYRAAEPTQRTAPKPRAAVVIAPLLVIPNLIAGLTGTSQAWPFACYPTFQWMAGEEIPHLAVDAVDAEGDATPIPTMPETQKEWGVVWSVVGATHGPVQPDRVRDYWLRRGRHVPDATSLRFYRAYSSVIPERHGAPPVRRVLITELACPQACVPPAGSPAR